MESSGRDTYHYPIMPIVAELLSKLVINARHRFEEDLVAH
jgi:hypothetical protein